MRSLKLLIILLGLDFTIATFNFGDSIGNSIIIIDDSEGVFMSPTNQKSITRFFIR